MFDLVTDHHLVALAGLVGGLLLGLAARLGRFCTLGAIEDALYGGSRVRLRMWGVALGVAVIGSFGLVAMGLLPLPQVHHLAFRWSPLASILGGLAFGYGMAMSGNCGFGALARLGGGDLRSFVIVVVMGISTYAALSGPLAPLRVWIFPQVPLPPGALPPGLAHGLAALTGLPLATVGLTIGMVILLGSCAYRGAWRDRLPLMWGAVVGLAIVTGWAGSAYVAAHGFAAVPVVSHSFAAPLGESILWTMTGSARPLSFATGSAAGVWLGACAGSLIRGHFRWEACDDPRELRRQILGAALMGVGAVVAVGCSIGQGLSAFSLLALSAPVTLAAIFAGAALGLRQLIEGAHGDL